MLVPKIIRRMLVAGIASLATSLLHVHALAAEPIRIGVVLSVSGVASFVGEPELKTLQIYTNQLNNSGGLLGRKLELVVYDDVGDATKARTFATRLAEQDKVTALIGGSTTGTTMAMIPVVESARIPFISLAGSVNVIDPVRKYVFKTPHTDRMMCEKIFLDMKKNGYTRIALLAGTDGFGLSMREQCMKVVGNFGLQVALEMTYGAQDTDMTPQLTKLKNTTGIQAVLNTGGGGQGPAIMTRNYGQLGIAIPLYHSGAVASKSFIDLAGKATEGNRLPSAALIIGDKLPQSEPQRAVVLGYAEVFQKATGQPVSSFGGSAYDAFMMLTGAIKRANSDDPGKVRDAIEQTKGFVGTAGVVNMSPTDHMGFGAEAFRLVEIRSGDWALVE